MQELVILFRSQRPTDAIFWLQVWDLREGHQLYTIHGHSGPVNSIRFSPGGDFFATAGDDKLVMTWRTNFDQVISFSPFPEDDFACVRSRERERERGRERERRSHRTRCMTLHAPSIDRAAARRRHADLPPGPEPEPPRPPTPSPPPPPTRVEAHLRGPTAMQPPQPQPTTTTVTPREGQALVPEEIAVTLSQIVAQLEVIRNTMSLFDRRLTMQESILNELRAARQPNPPPPTPPR